MTATNTIIQRIKDQGAITAADLQQMRDLGIKLSDVLRPGIYQFEFNVLEYGEHREWVKVNGPGTDADIITARQGADGQISVEVGKWETSTHGRLDTTHNEQRVFVIPSTVGQNAANDARWSNMVAEANHIQNLDLNYHFLAQNSNSVFFTVGLAGNLQANTDGYAPGYGLDLNTVNPNPFFQPIPLGPEQVSRLDGTAGSDVLTGNTGGQRVDGLAGNDQITGNNATDIIVGGEGNDTISLVGGSAEGGPGVDSITVTGALNVHVELNGGPGNDHLSASNQPDNLVGGDGDDWMHGKQGADQENGGSGNDTLYGGQGDDFLRGGDGLDQIYGDADNDLIMGNDGADTLQGGPGDDTISGGGQDDYIYGGQGNDLIIGGHFSDRMWGNLGADTFKIDARGNDWFAIDDSAFQLIDPYGWIDKGDRIMDFESGVDKIDLSDFEITFANLYFRSLGSTLEIDIIYPNGGGERPDGVIYLENVSSVQASDFIF